MKLLLACCALALALSAFRSAMAQETDRPAEWKLYITNDNCPDYTWGLTEQQTRKAFADVVRGHLDEMSRTDGQPPDGRDRYNMAVTQEALCFVEHYPDRKDELVRRIREGRVFVSPYLCNSLWAFQGVEAALRTFYPARRLERDWGVPIDVAEHIEEPSLPWGLATILAGCGIRWLTAAYLGHDSTFAGLKNPPLFMLEGPDGSRVGVVLDPWASAKANYTQGKRVLGDPKVPAEWVAHYRGLGDAYPLRAVLVSGTHGDISPSSGSQARQFAEAIIRHNARGGAEPRLVNATVRQFCQAVDDAQARKPLLPTLRGSFGHSWDLWPVCLAKYAADLRAGEQAYLAAEALAAVVAARQPQLAQTTEARRRHAEWCWAMLSDHAWNGTNDANKKLNSALRKKWSQDLLAAGRELAQQAWTSLGLKADANAATVFNPLSIPRADLVRIEGATPAAAGAVTSQTVREDGKDVLYFVCPKVPGFGFHPCDARSSPTPPGGVRGGHAPSSVPAPQGPLRASPTALEGPHYRLEIDPKTGGLASLVHKPTGRELLAPGSPRSLCQTVYHDGQEHTLAGVTSEVVAAGPVLARLKVHGTAGGAEVTNFITIYARLDRVDFDLRIDKPATDRQERLCQVFPVVNRGAVLRIDATGAVIRPEPAPAGDLLPGADTRRFAVQGFVDASLPDGPGVTIAPLEAFTLRRDLGDITFEALGNDQNYREVPHDQDGVRSFRFRYSLMAHRGPYDGPTAFAFSRAVRSPLLAVAGKLAAPAPAPVVTIDPARAIATCLKPPDDVAAGGIILRLRETAGQGGPVTVAVQGYTRAVLTDLLERDKKELPIARGQLTIDLRPHGLAAVRLLGK